MCFKTTWYYAKCTHAASVKTASLIWCTPALDAGCPCEEEDQIPVQFPLTGLCKQCKTRNKLKVTVDRRASIARWNAGDRLGALQAAMALPGSDDDSSNENTDEDSDEGSGSDNETDPEVETGSNAAITASDASGPRQSQNLTRSNPDGKLHRWLRWLDKNDPYSTKNAAYSTSSSSSILTNKAQTGKMTPMFKAPILWKDDHDKFGLRPLVLVQKQELTEEEKKPRRRAICAGAGGLQPLVLVEKHKKRWHWLSWDSYGREKAEESHQTKPIPKPSFQVKFKKTIDMPSRLPVLASRLGGQPMAVGAKKRSLLVRKTTFDRVTL
ncbi:uncharacterized protein N7511_009506 [Penicillium nucicola]|uniref:uncharacterized protein n=1 Tax=Penicillium nucicola TaxID=1850975 RepID=UPI00254576A8|nr:uncharacterized protein N7511_009506 [Penicillium nucicola]KAJ5747810.1 hypothetical protein N7511_009506 [Penicillium nucicola]